MKIYYHEREVGVPMKESRVIDLFKENIKFSKNNIIACKCNNEIKSLDFVVKDGDNIELIDITDKDGMRIYVRGILYIMAMAFNRLYPDAFLSVNYQLSNAMYCNLENMETTDEMLNAVSEKMREIIEKDLKIERRTMTREEAEEFYARTNTPKGRLQFDIKDNPKINMYYCEDYFNYFYETIATHTGATKIFELKKYSDGFLLRYPSVKDVNQLPEFQESKKLLWALQEYETIYKVLNVGTVYRLNTTVKQNKIKDLILLSEALHEKKISQIADKIAERKGTKMVLIAGPSSSGKTTFAQRLGILVID